MVEAALVIQASQPSWQDKVRLPNHGCRRQSRQLLPQSPAKARAGGDDTRLVLLQSQIATIVVVKLHRFPFCMLRWHSQVRSRRAVRYDGLASAVVGVTST